MRLSAIVLVVIGAVALLVGADGTGDAPRDGDAARSARTSRAEVAAQPHAEPEPTIATFPARSQSASSELDLVRQAFVNVWDEEAATNPRFDRLSECDTTTSDARCVQWRTEAEFSMVTRVAVDRLEADDAVLLSLLSDADVRIRLLALRALEASDYRGRLPTAVYHSLEERSVVEVIGVLARHLALDTTEGEGEAIVEYALTSSDSRVLEHSAVALASCPHRERLARLIHEKSIEFDDRTQRLIDSRCTAAEIQ